LSTQFAFEDLATLNAVLNLVALSLLLTAYWAVRRRRIDLHRRLMLATVATSTLFLISYVVYHAQAGSRPYTGTGVVRTFYLAMLATHVVLAAAIVPLVLVTLRRGLAMRVADHRRIARVTWPLWVYVSSTGVLVYLMLYVVRAP
jgi:putative membrane protein